MKTLSLQEAAEFLHLSPVTLRKRAAAGIVPGYKPGKAWVFLEDELLAYLKSKSPLRPLAFVDLATAGGLPGSADGEGSSLAKRIAAKRRVLQRERSIQERRRK